MRADWLKVMVYSPCGILLAGVVLVCGGIVRVTLALWTRISEGLKESERLPPGPEPVYEIVTLVLEMLAGMMNSESAEGPEKSTVTSCEVPISASA